MFNFNYSTRIKIHFYHDKPNHMITQKVLDKLSYPYMFSTRKIYYIRKSILDVAIGLLLTLLSISIQT